VLYHGEKETGMTAHYATEKVDEGNILLQKTLTIGGADNDGRLRWRLARLAGEMVPELVTMFSGFSKPAGTPQDHSLASFAPKPSVEDGYLDRASDIDTIRRKMKAFNPLPGTSIHINGRRIIVDRFELFQDGRADGLHEDEKSLDWIIGSKGIRLYKKGD
jgi:methionyl-tRNA formyltransferase